MAAPSSSHNDLSKETANNSPIPSPMPTHHFQDLGPYEIADQIFSHLEFRDRARYAYVCRRWHEIADDDSAYLRQCRRDMPDLTSILRKMAYKGGWKIVYIQKKINQFDVEHKRRVSNKFTLQAYASRPVIPYHAKNAGIEDHWKRKTSDDSWKVLDILQGAKEKKPIPRLKLWTMAKSDKVSYDVEFEIACRGYMRSEKSWLALAIAL